VTSSPYSHAPTALYRSGISSNSLVLEVNPLVPAATVAEFIPARKPLPARSAWHPTAMERRPILAGELFKMTVGIDMVHVRYLGAGPALTDLIGGQTHVMFTDITSSIE
jgi:tripartite-type tricarboxylate transporter receptor subunit TctC